MSLLAYDALHLEPAPLRESAAVHLGCEIDLNDDY